MGQEMADGLRELQWLAVRKPPSKEELKKAKELMRLFRQSGFTNREVSELSNGGWKEDAVKLYTRGSKTGDVRFKKRLADLFKELAGKISG